MFYCPDCCKFRPVDRCKLCGTRLLRGPAPGDLCFVEELEHPWTGLFADVLNQEQIAFVTKNDRPAALTSRWGYLGDRVRYYVFYEDYPRARELADGLFHMSE